MVNGLFPSFGIVCYLDASLVINPERGTKASHGKVVSKKTGKLAIKKAQHPLLWYAPRYAQKN